ncbi:MAG: septum formation family protein [Microbacteriaceae bacterium]
MTEAENNGDTQPFNWGLTPQNGDEAAASHEAETEALAAAGVAASETFAQVPEPFAVSEAPTQVPIVEWGEQSERNRNAGEPEQLITAANDVPAATTIVDTHTVPAKGEPKMKKSRKLGWWLGGGAAALVVVVALVFVSTQLSSWVNGGSVPAPSTATPTAALGPGTYQWDQLFGGECLDPFTSAWQQTYTVVDCAGGHAGQLVYKGSFDATPEAVFPGEAALAEQINALCTRNGIFDVAAATAAGSLQVQGSFPVTEEQWTAGQRNYFCFVNHTDGSSLTGSLQGSGPSA